jgi:hypothetical protein
LLARGSPEHAGGTRCPFLKSTADTPFPSVHQAAKHVAAEQLQHIAVHYTAHNQCSSWLMKGRCTSSYPCGLAVLATSPLPMLTESCHVCSEEVVRRPPCDLCIMPCIELSPLHQHNPRKSFADGKLMAQHDMNVASGMPIRWNCCSTLAAPVPAKLNMARLGTSAYICLWKHAVLPLALLSWAPAQIAGMSSPSAHPPP